MRRIVGFMMLFFCGVSVAVVRQQSDASIWLYNTPTPSAQLVISANGNVGIGTTAPSTKLDVAGTVSASALVVNGSIATAISQNTTSVTLGNGDSVFLANAVSGVITVTLPAAATAIGRQYTVKKIDGTANVVDISGVIDGASHIFLFSQYQYVVLTSDGLTNWAIVGGN